LATSSAFDQAMPDQGVTKAWYHRGYRHYGSYRGHHYGRHRESRPLRIQKIICGFRSAFLPAAVS
jgi:hypothetical protein